VFASSDYTAPTPRRRPPRRRAETGRPGAAQRESTIRSGVLHEWTAHVRHEALTVRGRMPPGGVMAPCRQRIVRRRRRKAMTWNVGAAQIYFRWSASPTLPIEKYGARKTRRQRGGTRAGGFPGEVSGTSRDGGLREDRWPARGRRLAASSPVSLGNAGRLLGAVAGPLGPAGCRGDRPAAARTGRRSTSPG